MYNCEGNLREIYSNVRLFRESEDISNKKYNRAYRLYSDIFEISIERVIETKIIDTILRDYLNSIKRLSNVSIR